MNWLGSTRQACWIASTVAGPPGMGTQRQRETEGERERERERGGGGREREMTTSTWRFLIWMVVLLRVKGSVTPISPRALSMALFTANSTEQLMHCGGSPTAAQRKVTPSV